jgi:hypothetical protein
MSKEWHVRVRLRFALIALIAGFVPLVSAGCGGGGSAAAVPAAAPAAASVTAPASAGATSTATAAPSTANASASSNGGLSISGFGGLKGETYAAHASGSTYDYAEIVTIDFPSVVNMTSFNAHFSVSPAAPWQSYDVNYGKRVEVTMRYTPGTTYAAARLQDDPGSVERVAVAGRAWARAAYGPPATARRLLDLVGIAYPADPACRLSSAPA